MIADTTILGKISRKDVIGAACFRGDRRCPSLPADPGLLNADMAVLRGTVWSFPRREMLLPSCLELVF